MPERGARRSLALLLAALVLSLAACTGGADAPPSPPATTPVAATATTTPTAPPATATTTAPPATATPTAPPATATATTTPTPAPTETPVPSPAATPTPSPTSTATPTPTPTEPPTTFRYDTYDTSGDVAEPGSYAFLADPADTRSAVTTYEGLRDGTATALRIHETDADGVSRAAFLDTVEVGDLFEWREAGDCWVRYFVMEVVATTAEYRRFTIEPFAYAPGPSCSGAARSGTPATFDWEPENITSKDVIDVRFGPFYLWSAEGHWGFEDQVPTAPDAPLPTEEQEAAAGEDITRHPFWREPDLPAGWRIGSATVGIENTHGYEVTYVDGRGRAKLALWSALVRYEPHYFRVEPRNAHVIYETRFIAGRPSIVDRARGTDPYYFNTVITYDESSHLLYGVVGYDSTLRGDNVEALVTIMRSLFESPNPPPVQTAFRYDTYDTTGAVAEPGSYAFLEDPADTSSAVTTYEGLRDGTATALRIHETDAEGVSRAAFLDTVEVGDLFEWRQAEDCWVRYRVIGVEAGSDVWEFGIKSYSHTYTGCSGAIGGSAARQFTWAPETLKTGAFTAPTWHGPSLVIPKNWAGPVPATAVFTGPSISWPPSPLPAPNLGTGWSGSLGRGYPDTELDGIYTHTDGGHLLVYIFQLGRWPIATYRLSTTYAAPGRIYEFRMIDGRHAVVSYDRVRTVTSQAMVVFYDEATGLVYTVRGGPKSRKNDPEATIDLARKFILPPAGPPPTTFRYDAYDTSGEVAAPGSYAFLANPADTRSAVTTYEGLRDGTTTALRIHETDAEGVSRAAFLDTVEVGDLFEWREAEDCFVRYTVTAVKPDPAGTVPRKSLGVESIAYAFTGCSGAIATGSASGSAANSASSSTASVTWGALPNLGGTSLTVPIVQGPFQLVPAGWTGATKPVGPRMPARPTIPEAEATSLAEARTFPHWREPELPEGWQFTYADERG